MAGEKELVDKVSDIEGLDRQKAAQAVKVVFDSLKKLLEEGERVDLPGFGSFAVSERVGRQGRNPATGEVVEIPASKNIRFKPGKEFAVHPR